METYSTTIDLRDCWQEVYETVIIEWVPTYVRVEHYGDPIEVWGEDDCPVDIVRNPVSNSEELTTHPAQFAGDWEVIVEPHKVSTPDELEPGGYTVTEIE